jgi:hypothetical protein
MKQSEAQRLTLIIRLRSCEAVPDWCGQVEMVAPYRKAVFRSRDELWRLLETWTSSEAGDCERARENKR